MSGVNDEMLMAFIDGELDDSSAEAVLRAIETDPAVARRAAVFETSRVAVRSAFAVILSEPAPRKLVDAIEGRSGPSVIDASASVEASPVVDDLAPESPVQESNVVALRRKTPARPRSFVAASPYALPLAACLALVVGLGSGVWIGQQGSGASGGSLFASGGALTAALSTQPSGPEAAVEIDGLASRLSILGSYSVDGGICRTFRMQNAVEAVRGVACDRGSGFAVDVAVADGSPREAGFAPASDGAAESLDAYLDTLEAEGPLSESEEADLLKGVESR